VEVWKAGVGFGVYFVGGFFPWRVILGIWCEREMDDTKCSFITMMSLQGTSYDCWEFK
jgi:hypothetical protein